MVRGVGRERMREGGLGKRRWRKMQREDMEREA